MSKTKAAGSTKLGRDSRAQRLGVKLFGGQQVKAGMVIVRQRGTKFHPGINVKRGADDTLYAARNGVIHFKEKHKTGFNGSKRKIKIIDVL